LTLRHGDEVGRTELIVLAPASPVLGALEQLVELRQIARRTMSVGRLDGKSQREHQRQQQLVHRFSMTAWLR
jgi:hypothetical protein